MSRFSLRLPLAALALAAMSAVPVLAREALPAELEKQIIERRIPEAAIWGMPAVNTDLMRQEMLTKTPGKVGEVIYWGQPLDWHNQTLTPNPDAIYFMVFYDTTNGPFVIDVPPGNADASFNGNIVDLWQIPLEDVGLLGIDKGAGGKFVLLPPGFEGTLPEGFSGLQLQTNTGYALLRSSLKSHEPADVEKAVAYGRTLRAYPLAEDDSSPETVFHDVKDVTFDSTIRYDASFFANLDRIIQTEPWIERDRAMIDTLGSLGIVKGQPFAPSAETSGLFEAGMQAVHAELEAKYDVGPPPFWEGSRWLSPTYPQMIKAGSEGFTDPNTYPVDYRGLTYTYAYIGLKRLGTGQMYLISIKDAQGNSFDGGSSYRLTVPPNVPVEQYWSVTVYDRETHALVKNMDRASRASNASDVVANADGSVDVFFGPDAPEGKASNWVPTDPAREFELMFRFYAPTAALLDKSWKLPDVEKVEN